MNSITTAPPAQTFSLSAGDRGTQQTVAKMRQLIDAGVKNPTLNRAAIQATWSAPQFQETQKGQALFAWLQQNFRFVPLMVGPFGSIQTLRTVDETLRVRGGSCADFSVLIPSLLGTIGIRSRIVTVAHQPDDPNEFSHVYPEAFLDGQWVAMDIARPDAAFGKSPEKYFRKRMWDIYSNAFQDVRGLSGYMGAIPKVSRASIGHVKSRLGDFDLSNLLTAPDISAITTGTANIVAASRAAPQNIVASSSGVPSSYTTIPGSTMVSGSLATSGIPSWLILLGGAAVLMMFLRN